MKQFIGYGFLIVLLGTTACHSTRVVKPLQPKEVMVGLDAGGPFFEFAGASIPAPFSSLLVAYGLDSTFTLLGGANITSAIFGNIQIDLGAVASLYRSKHPVVPNISAGLSVQTITSVFDGSFRLLPVADVNLYWHYWPKKQHYIYLNWGSWFNLWDRVYNHPPAQVYFPKLGLGHTFENAKMRYTAEVSYSAMGINNRGVPVLFSGIGGYGVWGAHIGVARKF